MTDDEERLRLAALQSKLIQLNAVYDRFGSEQTALSIRDLHNQMATIPEHIIHEDKVNRKLAEFERTVQAYVTRRRTKQLPAVADIWETVKGFEQHHDSNDLGNSSLLATILREARKLNIPEQALAQAAYLAEQAV